MPQPKYEPIYRAIKEEILNGTYAFGDFLPSENTYTEQFRCTRNTVRRALSILTSEGFLMPQHGKGIYIKNSEGLKITLDLLTRLKIERPLTVCIEPKRLDCHVQCEIAALAAKYPQSIRIRLLADTTEQDFVKLTHTILHTLPIGMFW